MTTKLPSAWSAGGTSMVAFLPKSPVTVGSTLALSLIGGTGSAVGVAGADLAVSGLAAALSSEEPSLFTRYRVTALPTSRTPSTVPRITPSRPTLPGFSSYPASEPSWRRTVDAKICGTSSVLVPPVRGASSVPPQPACCRRIAGGTMIDSPSPGSGPPGRESAGSPTELPCAVPDPPGLDSFSDMTPHPSRHEVFEVYGRRGGAGVLSHCPPGPRTPAAPTTVRGQYDRSG